MKKIKLVKIGVTLMLLFNIDLFSFQIQAQSNEFTYNGAADVIFRYVPRGSGGRALVHDVDNVLSINHAGDFSGGVRLGRKFEVVNGNNIFAYNGAADITFRYAGRGSGGRALVHDNDNILSLNFEQDFTGGTRVYGPLEIKNGGNLFKYNGAADITFRYSDRGSGGRALVHDENNVLSINYANDFSGGTKIGTAAIFRGSTSEYQLEICGTLRAREVKVNLTGCDFVFEDDYKLRTLNEVEIYIKENKRLPEIESAAEMEADGTNLGELNSKLLQKIEELTLYTIEQEKKINQLEKQNKRIEELEKQNKEILELLKASR
jgi:lipoate-protein ligase A